jgi:glyoxylase-like metal-dependent hydrolase (beta-lactamase superfamily II)
MQRERLSASAASLTFISREVIKRAGSKPAANYFNKEHPVSSFEVPKHGLGWQVRAQKRPGMTRDLPSGNTALRWVANASTLIYGERDAVLVDTGLTIEQGQVLVDWVLESGKELKSIYITHAHGDHFFGLSALLKRFPTARALATPNVVDDMADQFSPEVVTEFWEPLFPNQIPKHLFAASPMQKGVLELEGHKLVVVDTGRTDATHSTALHVPSIDLIAAGDVVYNGIHPSLDGTSRSSRLEWIASLDKLDALNPKAVVAGHKVPELNDEPRCIAETRQYLLDFNRLVSETTGARDLYQAMLELYPNFVNPGSLWGSATTAKKRP